MAFFDAPRASLPESSSQRMRASKRPNNWSRFSMEKNMPEQNSQQAIEDEDGQESGRSMDGEIKCISAILRMLDKQSDDGAARIVAYIHSRFCASQVREIDCRGVR